MKKILGTPKRTVTMDENPLALGRSIYSQLVIHRNPTENRAKMLVAEAKSEMDFMLASYFWISRFSSKAK